MLSVGKGMCEFYDEDNNLIVSSGTLMDTPINNKEDKKSVITYIDDKVMMIETNDGTWVVGDDKMELFNEDGFVKQSYELNEVDWIKNKSDLKVGTEIRLELNFKERK